MPDIARDIPNVPSYDGTDDYQRDMGLYTEMVSEEVRRDLHSLKNEDSTFLGAMEIDGSTDISGTLAVTGDVSIGGVFVGTDISISGDMWVDGTADFSSIGVDGTSTLADVSISGWLGVDGSADFSDVHIAGDLQPTKCISDSGGYLDEDDLVSDSTAAVASQQSIKAYVVANAGGSFGDYTDTAQSACGETIVIKDDTGDFEHIFCASTDAFIIGMADTIGAGPASAINLNLYEATNLIVGHRIGRNSGATGCSVSWTLKEGQYWQFDVSPVNTVVEHFWFQPLS